MAFKKSDEKLAWTAINVETLPEQAAKRYAKLKECFAATKAAREDLETYMSKMFAGIDTAKLPADNKARLIAEELKAGREAKFSYLRGMAIATATLAGPKSNSKAISF